MSDNELLLTINADIKGVKKAYEDIQSQTENLDQALASIAKVSAVAFAALSTQVVVALKAFGEAEEAGRTLTNTLQNQGIFTTQLRDKYKEYAEQIQAVTGIQADEITRAQAVAQGYLGQIPVTKQLTQAIADLAEQQKVSLPEAATELGKAIGNGTGMLLRQGLQFAATDTEADRYQKTLEFVRIKADGFAAAANTGLGSIKGLETAFHNAQEELGARFAPAATTVIKALTEFFTLSGEGAGKMVDLKAGFITAGLAVTALGVALPVAAQAFLAVRAAATALNLTLNATKLALAGLGIGLVILALTELVLHWEAVSTRIVQIVKGLVTFVTGAFDGLGKVINGAFHFDSAKIKEGLDEIQNAFKEGVSKAAAEIPKATEKALEEQDEIKKKYADKEQKQRNENEQARRELAAAEQQAILLELQNASQDTIDLKKKEIETLKALEQSKNEEQKALLRERLQQIRDDEEVQRDEDLERDQAFAEQKLAAKKSLDHRFVQSNDDLSQKELAQIKSSELTQREAEKKVFADELKEKIKQHNTFLEEQAKYGVAYATINQAIRSSEVQGVKSATSDLVALTQSKNATLKEIGKVASIAQIVIKTGEAAMNVYAGFSSIPFIGQALGAAAAAAVIAYGAEQVGNVQGAAQGALVQGSGYGDSVPFMLEPGELVTPRKNFEEVVTGVAQQRGLVEQNESGGGQVSVNIGFDGPEASRVLTARRIEDQALGTLRQT